MQGIGRGLQPWTDLFNLGTCDPSSSMQVSCHRPCACAATPNCGGDWSTTYTHSPQYVTSSNRSLFIASYDYMVFNLSQVWNSVTVVAQYDSRFSALPALLRIKSSTTGTVEVAINASSFSVHVLAGNSMLGLIGSYTTGQYAGPPMRPLPPWLSAGGAILGLEGGQANVQPRIEAFLSAHPEAPVLAVWLQVRSN